MAGLLEGTVVTTPISLQAYTGDLQRDWYAPSRGLSRFFAANRGLKTKTTAVSFARKKRQPSTWYSIFSFGNEQKLLSNRLGLFGGISSEESCTFEEQPNIDQCFIEAVMTAWVVSLAVARCRAEELGSPTNPIDLGYLATRQQTREYEFWVTQTVLERDQTTATWADLFRMVDHQKEKSPLAEVIPEVGTEEWDHLTKRRAELIYKKNRDGLSEAETLEYNRLKKISLQVTNKTFPPQLSELEQELAEITKAIRKNGGGTEK